MLPINPTRVPIKSTISSSNLFKWSDERFSPISPDDYPVVGKAADPISPLGGLPVPSPSSEKTFDSFTRTSSALHSKPPTRPTLDKAEKPIGPPAPALVVKPGTGRVPPLRVDVQEELSHELHQLRQQLGGQGEVSVRLPHQALVTPIPSSDVGKEENSGYLTICRTWGSGHACVKDVRPCLRGAETDLTRNCVVGVSRNY